MNTVVPIGLSGRLFLLLTPWLLPVGPVGEVPLQDIRQLTNHRATDYHPVFSPSGTQLLFTSRLEETPALFRISIDGGQLTQIPLNPTGDLYSDWHPDGRSILFHARN